MENNEAKARLKKKLKKKQAERSGKKPEPTIDTDVDIFKMISQVQSMLKSNPELVNKVSSCVNSLMANPELMGQLSDQIQKNVQDDTLATSSSTDEEDAVSNSS